MKKRLQCQAKSLSHLNSPPCRGGLPKVGWWHKIRREPAHSAPNGVEIRHTAQMPDRSNSQLDTLTAVLVRSFTRKCIGHGLLTPLFRLTRSACMVDGSGFLGGKRYLLHDRDTKFCAAFLDGLRAGGIRSLALPPRVRI